ncbi:MAG: transcription elongation factor GreA [Candidatus Nanopelagicales bacterium]|nr:transcription elongation factor GreA [Candidatus Nanopelagicales bacterium]
MSETAQTTWLTQEAHDRLAAELEQRQTTTRAEITRRIAAAREEGDLKENGGYHAAKDEQGKNEARIRQLRHMLEHAAIGTPPAEEGQAAHGMIVSVEVVGADRQMRFLLGSREEAAHAPADLQVVSPTSPMGQAVDGARVGDERTYTTPAGKAMTVRLTHVEPYAG